MTTTSAPADHAAVAYDAVAPFYDVLTRHDNYTAFADILDRLLREASPPGRRLLDAGCGNGRSTLEFASRGWETTGADISAAMIATARERHAGTGITFHVHDIREPLPGGPYDVVLCMSDIVNYLLEPEEVSRAFGRVAEALRPGGVLIFDANTAHGYEQMATAHVRDEPEAFVSMRGRHLDREHTRFELAIDVFRQRGGDGPGGGSGGAGDGGWVRDSVRHLQRHHSSTELTALLRKAGLVPSAEHGLHISGRLAEGVDEERHTKGLYVATRPSAASAASAD